MRLEIDAGGRKVSAEASDTNTSPRELLAELLAVWKQTEGATGPSDGPGYGFTNNLAREPIRVPLSGGYMYEPKAEGDDCGDRPDVG